MAVVSLFVAAAASAVAGTAFEVVAQRIHRVHVSPEHRFANRAHVLWWACLGAYLLLQGALTFLAALGSLSETIYLFSRVLAIPLLCIAVWGLCTYLAFLYTGSTRAKTVFAVLYSAVAVLFGYATFGQTPDLLITDWLVTYEDDSALYRSIYVLVGAPPIIASVAYLSLRRRVEDQVQRRRLVLTSIGILAYVGSGLSARLSSSDIATFVTLVPLGLLSAGTVLAAHLTTGRARSRPVIAPQLVADPALAHRLRELI